MTLPYYPMYPRDFFEGTQQMSLEEKGAYVMVLNLMYTNGGPVSDEPKYLSRYVGCSVRKWKQIREALIEMGKLVVENELIRNLRADEVLEKQRLYQLQQAENRANPNKNKADEKPPSPKPNPPPEPRVGMVDLAREREEAELSRQEIEALCVKAANGSLASEAVAPGIANIQPIINLMRPARGEGCSLYQDLLPLIADTARRKRATGGQISTWEYFRPGAIRARDQRLQGNPEPEKSNERTGQSRSNGAGGYRRGSQDLDEQRRAFLAGRGIDPDGAGAGQPGPGEDVLDASYEVVR